MLVWNTNELYSVRILSTSNTIMKKLKEVLIKVIDKIDGFFLQLYPELTKHMNKKDDK
jgi:hypothetical protein